MSAVFQLERDHREDALILASALAWAVGKLEGLGQDPGYAGQTLEWWRYPQFAVEAEPDSAEAPSTKAVSGSGEEEG